MIINNKDIEALYNHSKQIEERIEQGKIAFNDLADLEELVKNFKAANCIKESLCCRKLIIKLFLKKEKMNINLLNVIHNMAIDLVVDSEFYKSSQASFFNILIRVKSLLVKFLKNEDEKADVIKSAKYLIQKAKLKYPTYYKLNNYSF